MNVSRLRTAVSSRLSSDGMHHLFAFLIIASLAYAFLSLADDAIEGDSEAFDRAVLQALREPGDLADPIGPAWFEEGVRDVTALGGTAVLTLISLAAVGYLLLVRKPRTLAFLLLAIVGGLLVSLLLKDVYDRPRPGFLPHGQVVYTQSFPSGHSMNAAVVYLTLATILARAQRRRVERIYLVTVSILVTVLVGLSRLFLGVHWPTDVLAGWVAGAAWAMLCYLLVCGLQRAHAIEQANEGVDEGGELT